MKVLIIKLSSIGDVIHTLPALSALRRGLGKKARIDWLVEEAASSLLKGHPDIDDVITVRRWSEDAGGNLRAAKRLASENYDIVMDFQGLLKSGAWVFLTKGKKRIGFSNARELSHVFLNEKLPADVNRHAVERYLELAVKAGGRLDGVDFALPVNTDAKERIELALEEKGIKRGAGFFAVVPRARWETKLWNDEGFAGVAKKVISKKGLYAVFVGAPKDKSALEKMCGEAGGKAVSLAGRTDLLELAELLRLARFVVTVDSGPMHLAAAVGTKVVALFGPTAPWRTGPYGKGHVIVRKGLDCSPCFRKKCPDVKCMKGITVEDVVKAVDSLSD